MTAVVEPSFSSCLPGCRSGRLALPASLMGEHARLERLAVVEDEPSLLRALLRALEPIADEVRGFTTVREACDELERWAPQAILLDLALPDGSAFDVLEVAYLTKPTPVVLAMSGTATPVDTFRLAQAGVRAFVPKPLTLDGIAQALEEALEHPPALDAVVRAQVGHVPIREVETEVRRLMVDEALARADGSRRGAARLLSISRQLLQHILRRDGEE